MGTGVVALRLTRKRGKMVVQSLGRTQRGTRYLKSEVTLTAANTTDESFKSDLRAAAIELSVIDSS